jgi:hypothetical protein
MNSVTSDELVGRGMEQSERALGRESSQVIRSDRDVHTRRSAVGKLTAFALSGTLLHPAFPAHNVAAHDVDPAAAGEDADAPLVGTWRLASFESRDALGVPRLPMGRAVVGQLMYDRSGRMSMHIMRPDRPRFASGDRAAGTDAEVRAAFVGYLAYFGRYTVDVGGGVLTHHVDGASFPDWVGGRQVRRFALDGNRLTITTPSMLAGGRDLTTVLTWERET